MANEITVSGRIHYKSGLIDEGVQRNAYKVDQDGEPKASLRTVYLVDGVVTMLDKGDVSETGYCHFRNVTGTGASQSAWVEVGDFDGVDFWPTAKLYDRDPATLPVETDSGDVFARAVGGNQTLLYWINQR